MGSSDIERVAAFDHRYARAQATDVVDFPWGFALLQREFPLSEWHNRIVVTSAVPGADVLAAADAVLGGAGLQHRYVNVDDDLGRALTKDLVAAGYEHETVATMIYAGPEVEPPAHDVRAVSLDELRPSIIRDWRATLPAADDEVLRQLADRTVLHTRGAELTLLAVYSGNEIAAHGHLYVDRVARIAQFENLATHDEFRRRGYGDALVRAALRRGVDAGCDVSFLTADLDGWPYRWYQRLGYAGSGHTLHFTRHH